MLNRLLIFVPVSVFLEHFYSTAHVWHPKAGSTRLTLYLGRQMRTTGDAGACLPGLSRDQERNQ
jgi:hypothetical protein